MYLYYLPLIALLGFFVYPSISGVGLIYKMNYQKEKSVYKAIKKTVKTISWVGYLMMYQKIYKNLVVVKKNEYDIHYVYHGQLYKIKCKHNCGPQAIQILMITNEKLEDITKEIISYMGPKYNFHNLSYCPGDFKMKEMSFYLSNGDIVNFTEKEYIKIQ